MNRHLRFFSTLFILLLVALATIMNWRLYYEPNHNKVSGQLVNSDLLAQLRFLRERMERGADVDMQQIYPEGYLFFNAIYGLAWCDFARSLEPNSILFAEAHVEIQRAFNNINSEDGRGIFDSALQLPYGAFYRGWSMYVLGKKLSVELPAKRDSVEVALFKKECAEIASVIAINPYPESYYGSAWPTDAVMCLAALAQHDRIFPPQYRHVISAWWTKVNQHLDKNGLLPHEVNPHTYAVIEHARGSSQSPIQTFLPEIVEGPHGFEVYKKLFLDETLGLYGIREYPKGTKGDGDIDSGPIIFGMGGSATVVGIRAMHANQDYQHFQAIRNSVEAIAFPYQDDGRKKYLFGKHPIADAFIAWTHSAGLDRQHIQRHSWRFKFQIISGTLSLAGLVGLFFMWRRDVRIQKLWQVNWRDLLPARFKRKKTKKGR